MATVTPASASPECLRGRNGRAASPLVGRLDVRPGRRGRSKPWECILSCLKARPEKLAPREDLSAWPARSEPSPASPVYKCVTRGLISFTLEREAKETRL